MASWSEVPGSAAHALAAEGENADLGVVEGLRDLRAAQERTRFSQSGRVRPHGLQDQLQVGADRPAWRKGRLGRVACGSGGELTQVVVLVVELQCTARAATTPGPGRVSLPRSRRV